MVRRTRFRTSHLTSIHSPPFSSSSQLNARRAESPELLALAGNSGGRWPGHIRLCRGRDRSRDKVRGTAEEERHDGLVIRQSRGRSSVHSPRLRLLAGALSATTHPQRPDHGGS